MQIIHKTLPTDHNLYLISDIHTGTLLQHEHGIEQMIQMVLSDKNNYVAILGDLAEAITIDDKRYDPATTDDRVPTPLQQYKSLVELFRPIKERIVVVLEGNHDYKISARFGNGVRDIFCSGLNVPFGTYSCKFAVNDRQGRLQYKAYLTHGYGQVSSTADDPVRQEANMFLALKRKLAPKAGDCAIMACGHCLSDDTEVLTQEGWRDIETISPEDVALTFNTFDECAEWQQIEQIHVHQDKYVEMYECKNRMINFCVTPEHRIIVSRNLSNEYNHSLPRKGRNSNLPKGIYKKGKKYSYQIRRKGEIVSSGLYSTVEEANNAYLIAIKDFEISRNKWTESQAMDCAIKSMITIPVSAQSGLEEYPLSDDWIKLLGWLIAEGHFRKNGAIQLFQNVGKHEEIERILNALGIKYSRYERNFAGRKFNCPHTGKQYTTNHNSYTFYISVKEAINIRKLIASKDIPDYAFNFSDRQFGIFLDALISGDGHWHKPLRSGTYYSKDKNIIDKLQALCVSHGWKAYCTSRKGSYELGVSYVKKTNIFQYSWRKVEATKTVWCVSVPNGTIFTRRNGRVSVLGNTHKLLVKPPISRLYLADDGVKVKQHYTKADYRAEYIDPDLRWYCNTGSFYKNFHMGESGYAERFGYNPTELGFCIVETRGGNINNVRKVILD